MDAPEIATVRATVYTQECRRAANHLSELLDSRLCSTDLGSLAAQLQAPAGERAWKRVMCTDDADAWLDIAQAFAGAPGGGRTAGQFSA